LNNLGTKSSQDEAVYERFASNIQPTNEDNEIAENAALTKTLTDEMLTEQEEETVYNPIKTELWVLLCSLSNEHAIFHLILYFFFFP
jgi:hypothetical protein